MSIDTISVLFQNEDLFVVDKPYGLVVNRAESVKGSTLHDWVLSQVEIGRFQENDPEFFDRAGIVHRLDKDTSGVLVIAKNPVAFRNLQKQFKDRVVQKVYLSLVHGLIVPRSGTIQAPVGRLPWNRTKFGVFPAGRDSTTDYKVLEYYEMSSEAEKLSYVEVRPHTGRTHQIRVHFQYLKHPIVSDPLYVGRKRLRSDTNWCPRLFLHALSLTFTTPNTNKEVTVTASLPKTLSSVLENLTITHV